MENLIQKFKIERENILSFAIFLVIAVLIGVFLGPYLATIGTTLLIISLSILIFITWSFAGYAVMKALFLVGAELTLVIFLSQAYCDVPTNMQTANDALKTLVGFSILYIGIYFFAVVYKEIQKRTAMFKEANDNKIPWLLIVPFAIFTGLFMDGRVVSAIYPEEEKGIKVVSNHFKGLSEGEDFARHVVIDRGTKLPPVPCVSMGFNFRT